MSRVGHSPRLYKYFPPERSGFLADPLVRYSPLGAFNDPFEGRPEVTAVMGGSELEKALGEVLRDEIRSSYEKLPWAVREKVSPSVYADLTLEAFHANEASVHAAIGAFTKPMANLLQKKFDELIGALCLTETPDNLLMWAHYANSHTGFVVEFDTTHPHFDERRSDADEFRHLRQVNYRDTRPNGALTDMNGYELFTVKSTHWSYEREWRILRPLPDAERVVSVEPYPVHLFRIPFGAISSVILGARCSVETASTLARSVREQPELASVNLLQAIPDESQFLLRVESVAT
jgi:hypothetical protein